MNEPRKKLNRVLTGVCLSLFVVVTVPCCAFVGYNVKIQAESNRWRTAYEATAKGMPRAEVEQLLPGPCKVVSFGDHKRYYWDGKVLDSVDSHVVLRHTIPTWYISIVYEFVFDADGKLVARNVYD